MATAVAGPQVLVRRCGSASSTRSSFGWFFTNQHPHPQSSTAAITTSSRSTVTPAAGMLRRRYYFYDASRSCRISSVAADPSRGLFSGWFFRHEQGAGAQRRSSTTASTTQKEDGTCRRLGLGSTKWSRLPKDQYAAIVGTALRHGVTVLEAGPEGGAAALCDAVRQYYYADPENNYHHNQPLEILLRVGYRLQQPQSKQPKEPSTPTAAQDVVVVPPPNKEEEDADDDTLTDPTLPFRMHDVAAEPNAGSSDDDEKEEYAVHNISPAYLEYALHHHPNDSPVAQLKRELGATGPPIQLTVLLHNPEVQQLPPNPTTTTTPDTSIEEKLFQAFAKLEEMDMVDSYGVSSNGLCLPAEHPLHLPSQTVLRAAQRVLEQSPGGRSSKFRVVQLPVNALETVGVGVAQQLHQQVQAYNNNISPTVATGDNNNNSNHKLNLEIYGMRPLTCYPDQGTGTGRPFVLTDYQLPATMEKKLTWTNAMVQAPQLYHVALQTALHHFDAETLIEKKQQGDTELTADERETLDGCKLMQSVLHDLDAGLEQLRSFAAHEDALYQQVIPVIQDTFESYDEDTARVLQSFFGAYNLAVRYYVAKNTRHLLRHGESSSSSSSGDRPTGHAVTYTADKLPDSKRLQEFALEFVLKQKVGSSSGNSSSRDDGMMNRPAIDKIILGFSQPDQVVSAVEIVRAFQEKHENNEGLVD